MTERAPDPAAAPKPAGARTDSSTRSVRWAVRSRAVAAVGVLCLIDIAWVHARLAPSYVGLGSRPFSLGEQFCAQSAAAMVLALALAWLVCAQSSGPRRLVRALCWCGLAFALTSLLAVVYSRYSPLPVPGLPGGFQEAWTADAYRSVVAELGAAVSFAWLAWTTRR